MAVFATFHFPTLVKEGLQVRRATIFDKIVYLVIFLLHANTV